MTAHKQSLGVRGVQMVVIFGQPSDLCASLTHQYLRRSGTEVAFIDDSQFLTAAGLSWSPDGLLTDSFLTLHSSRIPLAVLTGVLARTQQSAPGPSEVTAEDRKYIATELHATMLGFLSALPCPVINRPIHGMARRPVALRVENARQILECGFKLPAILMTSSEERAIRFYDRFAEGVLVGVLSGREGWRLVRGREGIGQLKALLARGPVCLQEVPPGQWLQVVTVGDQAFAAEAYATHLGEERSRAPLQTVEPSSTLRTECCRLARAFQLEFAQFEVVQTGTGERYCLDVSPWPALGACAEPLQESIVASLAQLLEGGDPHTA
jgi:hypothetical protein